MSRNWSGSGGRIWLGSGACGSRPGLVPLLSYLRELGVVPPAAQPARSSVELLLGRYREYLLVERGLMAGTARGYLDMVRPFVVSRAGEDGELELAGLTPADVLGFVLADSERRPRRGEAAGDARCGRCWGSCTWRA